jgi:trehalose 6-phosphate synthase
MYDPDAVGAAIARAVAMPRDERKARHQELYAALLRNDISKWGDRFLKALGPQERRHAQRQRGAVM